MPKKPGNGGHGPENYDPETGRYVESPSSENGNEGDNSLSPQDFSSFISDDKKQAFFDFLKEKAEKNKKAKQRENFFQRVKKIDEAFSDEAIETIYTDEFIEKMKNYNFHTTDPGDIYGASNTSHSHINAVLTNEIARETFKPMKIENDKSAFRNLVKDFQKKYTSNDFAYSEGVDNLKQQPGIYIQRGFSPSSANVRMTEYTTGKFSGLVLPNGAYGSCIYTAYDNFQTANSYSSGYIMEGYVSNQNGNILFYDDYYTLQREFSQKKPQIMTRLKNNLEKRGYDSTVIDGIIRQFDNTSKYDENFVPLVCGYDAVVETNSEYCLVLNGKAVTVLKNW